MREKSSHGSEKSKGRKEVAQGLTRVALKPPKDSQALAEVRTKGYIGFHFKDTLSAHILPYGASSAMAKGRKSTSRSQKSKPTSDPQAHLHPHSRTAQNGDSLRVSEREGLPMSNIEHHLAELETALNPDDPQRIQPALFSSDQTILDIGCGIGQTLVALNCSERICVGVDIDEEAISYGIKNYGHKIQFILCDAARLPLPSNTFDLVYSRVSLPYTNIPRVLKEMRRVLKDGGRVWMTLHSRNRVKRGLQEAIKSRNVKNLASRLYTMINGYSLKYFGFLFPRIDGKYESWQDLPAMTRILTRMGFEVKVSNVGNHTVFEGVLKRK